MGDVTSLTTGIVVMLNVGPLDPIVVHRDALVRSVHAATGYADV